MKSPYIECGKIVSVHGVRGAVKVEPWCDSPQVLCDLEEVCLKGAGGYDAHAITGGFVHGKLAVLTLTGIGDRSRAEMLRGQVLYAHRDRIPVAEGAMLQCDMLGLDVIDASSGKVYGTLLRIDPSPASDLYVVKTQSGEVLLPAVPAFIKEVTPQGILVTPIPGFFDED